MLVLVIPVAGILTWIIALDAIVRRRPDCEPLHASLGATLVATAWVGALGYALPVVLSTAHLLTTSALSVAWFCAGILAPLTFWLSVTPPRERRDVVSRTRGVVRLSWRYIGALAGSSRMGAVWLGAIAFIVAATAVAGLLYPVVVWDSNTHHMPRVVQFIQQASVAPFQTFFPPMNSTYPYTAYLLTQVKLLSGGDGLLNLVQWSFFVIGIPLVFAIARRIGASRSGALFASLIYATAPVVIVQAQTTQYDLVAGVWVLATLATWLYREDIARQVGSGAAAALFGATIGLGAVTKVSYLVVLAPFAVAAGVAFAAQQVRPLDTAPPTRVSAPARIPLRTVARTLAVAALVAAIIASPWYGRNALLLDGDLLGTSLAGNAHLTLSDRSPRALALNAVRNLSVLAGTPIAAVNAIEERAVAVVVSALGYEYDSPVNKETPSRPFYIPTGLNTHNESPAPATMLVLLLATLVVAYRGVRPARTAGTDTGGATAADGPHASAGVAYTLAASVGLLLSAAIIPSMPFVVRNLTVAIVAMSPVAGLLLAGPRVTISSRTGGNGAPGRTSPSSRSGGRWTHTAAQLALGLTALAVALVPTLFAATSPLMPPSWLSGSGERALGWWNVPYAERTVTFSVPECRDALSALHTQLAASPSTTSERVAVIGGSNATDVPTYPLIALLVSEGYRVVYDAPTAPANGIWHTTTDPGLIAPDSTAADLVVSYDYPSKMGAARVGGHPVSDANDLELVWKSGEPDSIRAVSIWSRR